MIWIAVAVMMDRYQEQPHLLDPHLGKRKYHGCVGHDDCVLWLDAASNAVFAVVQSGC